MGGGNFFCRLFLFGILSKTIASLSFLLYNVSRGGFMSFREKIWQSLFTSDIYILYFVIFALICLLITLLCSHEINKNMKKWECEKYYKKLINTGLNVCYTLFVTIISIFPLLGMFGTVKALLELDLSNVNSAKNNFFDALTSTTWGILFAVIFKLVNAFISTSVENNIQKLADLIKKFEDSGISLKDSKNENKRRRAKK